MKIPLLAAIGLGVGVFAGSAVGAVRTKNATLAALAAHDALSVATQTQPASAEHADDGVESMTLPPEAAGGEPAAAEPEAAGEVASNPTSGTHAPAPPASVEERGPADDPAASEALAPTKEIEKPEAAAENDPESLSALDPEGAKKLAKIFSQMKAPAAAAVLVEMSNEEVTAILLRMSERQAGPIVGEFPADRAASLGRVVLKGQEGGS